MLFRVRRDGTAVFSPIFGDGIGARRVAVRVGEETLPPMVLLPADLGEETGTQQQPRASQLLETFSHSKV